MTDLRVATRKRVLKSGTIEFGGGVIDCAVRNLSETGAALSVESPVGIPSDFVSDRRIRPSKATLQGGLAEGKPNRNYVRLGPSHFNVPCGIN